MLLLSLIGCLNDFGIQALPKEPPGGLDSAADPADSDPPADSEADSAADSDPTDPVDDTGAPDSPPEDTAPVEDPPDDPPPADDCDDTSDLIYALSRDDDQLYTFDPATLTFAPLGEVDCNTTLYPQSMAISRDGTAYIRYEDDALYALDLATMRCSPTGYSDRRSGFGSFGMGYATDSANTWRDRLYVANDREVGVLDPAAWTISTIGRLPSQAELTGNADGELWAMLPLENPAELRRIHLTSGATEETLSLPAFPDPSTIDTFAFATHSGDFYLFVRQSGMGNSTDVYRVERSGTMRRVLQDSGLNIVGAGISTCSE